MKVLIQIVLIILLFTIFGCRNYLFNAALQSIGAYDDEIQLQTFKRDQKEVVFFPMQHLGTEPFYDNVRHQVDSLVALDYYFYWEKVKAAPNQDSILRKFRKIMGIPIPKGGYKNVVDSVLGKKFEIKFKKKLIDQPSYSTFGLDTLNSQNVDATLQYIVTYYENEYGKISLQDCDFETTVFEETTCDDPKVDKVIRNDYLINSRNQVVLQTLDNETHDKIAIIYGKGHMEGLIEGLIKRGYTLFSANKE